MSSGRLLTASDMAASAPFAMVGKGRSGSDSGSGSGEEGSASSDLLEEGDAVKYKVVPTHQSIPITGMAQLLLHTDTLESVYVNPG